MADAGPSRSYTSLGRIRAALDTDYRRCCAVPEHPHDDAAEDSWRIECRWRQLRPLPLRRPAGAGHAGLSGARHRPARAEPVAGFLRLGDDRGRSTDRGDLADDPRLLAAQ